MKILRENWEKGTSPYLRPTQFRDSFHIKHYQTANFGIIGSFLNASKKKTRSFEEHVFLCGFTIRFCDCELQRYHYTNQGLRVALHQKLLTVFISKNGYEKFLVCVRLIRITLIATGNSLPR